MPKTTVTIETTTPLKIVLNLKSIEPPTIHHLKPSITATIGFKSYHILYRSGITLESNPIGEMYKPNWITNGLRVIGGNRDGSVDAISKIDKDFLVDPLSQLEIKNKILRLLSKKWTFEDRIALSKKCKDVFSDQNLSSQLTNLLKLNK